MAEASQWIVDRIDRVAKWVAWWSIIALILELAAGGEHSHEGHPFWLWNERVIGVFFAVEFLARLWRSGRNLREYLISPFGIIAIFAKK